MNNFTTRQTDADDGAEILKVLAHPIRLCIVRGLLRQGSANVSTIQECLSIPQSTVSQHLAKLRAYEIVDGVRQGTEIHYTVINDTAKRIVSALYAELICDPSGPS